MKKSKGYIISLIYILVFMGVCISCTHEEPANSGNGTENIRHFLVFHVRSLETTASSESREMLKSLRIIMLSDGALEKNEYISFGDEGIQVERFNYDFLWETIPGKKEFYLFANEESVKSIEFSEIVSLPSEIGKASSLTEFLSYFTPPENEENFEESEKTANAELNLKKGLLLKKLTPSIIFNPDYTSSLGSVFLPYSSSYTGNYGITLKEDEGSALLSNPLYLVPVATKFTFRFTNLTKDQLKITNLTISKVNVCNYLFANVGDRDYEKNFSPVNEEPSEIPESDRNLYWVYWLAKVAKASQENSAYFDNVNFNDTYGWITDYNLPNEDLTPYNFLTNMTGTGLTVPSPEDEDSEYSTTTEVFYIPESKNLVDEMSGQSYQLTLGVEKNGESRHKDLNFYNLKALFRNTAVRITVTISDTDMKIYAEISPWSPKVANGWLKE